jgi:hypothetical protein
MIIIFWEMTPYHFPEDDNHHTHRRGNLKSYINKVVCYLLQIQSKRARIDQPQYVTKSATLEITLLGATLLAAGVNFKCSLTYSPRNRFSVKIIQAPFRNLHSPTLAKVC